VVTVKFSASLRERTGESDLTVDAGDAPSVRRLIKLLDERFPGVGEQLSDGHSVAINGEIIADPLYEDIPDGAEVHFIPAIAGG